MDAKKDTQQQEQAQPVDILDALVDFFERLADKYNFDEDEQAEFRKMLFAAENVRNAGEPVYDANATEMVEEDDEYGED
ncbi:MAG: hypothetical protein II265_01795 [Clostridia bacterium]|nr:hypothetical protein [Clostridia bacterium]